MRTYLVKWDDLSTSVITAQNDADLFDLLEQRSNPYDVTFEEIELPVWIDFPPVAELGELQEGEEIGEMAARLQARAKLPEDDVEVGYALVSAVLAEAHPEVGEVDMGRRADRWKDHNPFLDARETDKTLLLRRHFVLMLDGPESAPIHLWW